MTVSALDKTLAGTAHANDEVSKHLTTVPAGSVELMNISLLVPAAAPLVVHW